jgi:hypothetical protein
MRGKSGEIYYFPKVCYSQIYELNDGGSGGEKREVVMWENLCI